MVFVRKQHVHLLLLPTQANSLLSSLFWRWSFQCCMYPPDIVLWKTLLFTMHHETCFFPLENCCLLEKSCFFLFYFMNPSKEPLTYKRSLHWSPLENLASCSKLKRSKVAATDQALGNRWVLLTSHKTQPRLWGATKVMENLWESTGGRRTSTELKHVRSEPIQTAFVSQLLRRAVMSELFIWL